MYENDNSAYPTFSYLGYTYSMPCQYHINNELFCFYHEETWKRHIRDTVWFQQKKQKMKTKFKQESYEIFTCTSENELYIFYYENALLMIYYKRT